MLNTTEVTVDMKFADARKLLIGHKNVDGEPAGESPVTIRWLNKSNTFVNIGIEDFMGKTRIFENQNSYKLKQSDIQEIAELLEEKRERTEHQQSSDQQPSNAVPGTDGTSVLCVAPLQDQGQSA